MVGLGRGKIHSELSYVARRGLHEDRTADAVQLFEVYQGKEDRTMTARSCPFCGSTRVTVQHRDTNASCWTAVECRSCFATGPPMRLTARQVTKEDLKVRSREARSRWEKRTAKAGDDGGESDPVGKQRMEEIEDKEWAGLLIRSLVGAFLCKACKRKGGEVVAICSACKLDARLREQEARR